MLTKREIITCGIATVILLWLIMSTTEVWYHNFCNGTHQYSKANAFVLISSKTTEMKVVDCQGVWTDEYEITVEDIKGNQWAYIDSTPKANGEIIRITMSGTEIINAK